METKFIIVGNQKGGVGKSTLTIMLANYLAYEKNLKVCVIDADHKQKTIKLIREQYDIPFLLANEVTNEEIAQLYPIRLVDSQQVYDLIENELAGEFDAVFIDLPGNIMQPGVVTDFGFADLIIMPMSISINDTTSTEIFMDMLDKHINPIRKEMGKKPALLKTLLFRVDDRIKEFKAAIKDIETMNAKFNLFASYISEKQSMLPRHLKTYPGQSHDTLVAEYKEFFEEFNEIYTQL